MTALQITELKSFMKKLLGSDLFDEFLLQEATLQMGISYHIDGRINQAFYESQEEVNADINKQTFISYKEVRGLLFDLIKGKHTPLGFQVVLQLPPQKCDSLFPEGLDSHFIKSLLCNIRFDGSKTSITSAINYYSFSLDKTPEAVWDNALTGFLKEADISFEPIS